MRRGTGQEEGKGLMKEGKERRKESKRNRWEEEAPTRSEANVHFKKGLAVFPSPAWMSLTKLFMSVNNLVFPAQGEFGQ
jgi:hypothetical protein